MRFGASPGRGTQPRPPEASLEPLLRVPPGDGEVSKSGEEASYVGRWGLRDAQSPFFPAPSPPPQLISTNGTPRRAVPVTAGVLGEILPPPFFPPSLLFFFFISPFSFFVNEKRRSQAVPGTAALGVLVAAPSERAQARSSGGLALLAHSCLPPPASAAREGRWRRRGPAAEV